MKELSVLYDGWSLIYAPDSPAALHLLTLLEYHPDEVDALLALPAPPPSWLTVPVEFRVIPAASSSFSQLAWQQQRLPALARSLKVDLIHLTTLTPALFGSVPSLVSPAWFAGRVKLYGMADRWREALAQGGMTRVRGVLWPEDLPRPDMSAPVFGLPPVVYPGLRQVSDSPSKELLEMDLPETYILYHGPVEEIPLRRVLAAWSWAADVIGEYYPLIVMGLDPASRNRMMALSAEYRLKDTVRFFPQLSPLSIPWIYQRCSVLFHPAQLSPWAGPVRFALYLGRPVVAAETLLAQALVGPAAYLVKEEDARQFGAALITLVVEEGVANRLVTAGLERVSTWRSASFRKELLEIYRQVVRAHC